MVVIGRAKMVATYHSVIGSLKLQGGLARDFMGTFFKKSLTVAGIIRT